MGFFRADPTAGKLNFTFAAWAPLSVLEQSKGRV